MQEYAIRTKGIELRRINVGIKFKKNTEIGVSPPPKEVSLTSIFAKHRIFHRTDSSGKAPQIYDHDRRTWGFKLDLNLPDTRFLIIFIAPV